MINRGRWTSGLTIDETSPLGSTPSPRLDDMLLHTASLLPLVFLFRQLYCCRGHRQVLTTTGTLPKLRSQGIFVLRVANIENVFLAEDVLKEAARLLGRKDFDELVEKVKKFVVEEYGRRRDDLVITAVRQKAIRHLLYPNLKADDITPNLKADRITPDLKADDITALDTAYKEHVSAFDAPHEYTLAFESSDKLLSNRDYAGILASFCGKGLPEQISFLFEMKPKGYMNHVIRMAKADKGRMRIILRQQLPSLG